ncbi:DUF5615 family PIN-like protein [Agromyces sp. NPDC058484]|uniref:DUF5615 family PIN-like protein n=1 Tax=Agromyces sp. NPDC058484 TaxID=3346524 RepID=UPI003664D72D
MVRALPRPRAIASGAGPDALRSRPVAEHVTDIGPGGAPDRELWRYALDHDAVLVTKGEDFSNMLLLGGTFPAMVWVRVGNTRRRALLEWFEPLIDSIVELVDAGNRLIELR